VSSLATCNTINRTDWLGQCDVLFITLDTLRFDVAQRALEDGQTPFFSTLLPPGGWEPRHTPGSFTFAAHQAFFAGFLPTPIAPGKHRRIWALEFPGSETIGEETVVFQAPDIVAGFRQAGYRTICIGGVGFFNKLSPLGGVLPGLFDESYWSPEMGVTAVDSTQRQVDCALNAISTLPSSERVFLFINISALHQPNCLYAPGAMTDSPATQAAALAYVDQCLPRLFSALRKRSELLAIVCSDHGTAYGEEGYQGHRLAHPVVWTVPYAELRLPRIDSFAVEVGR
jgi:hypothetical protein